MADFIGNHWKPWFRDLYGGEWPRSFVTFDLETTGFSLDRDVITEIGHCLVQDGEVVDRFSVVLDWTHHHIVPAHYVRERLSHVAAAMYDSGHRLSVSWEQMQEEGVEPEKALQFYYDLFRVFQSKGLFFAAHGGYAFDEKMLDANFKGFGISHGFAFDDNELFDTHCLEKATQADNKAKLLPEISDTLRSYFLRVNYAKCPGVKSKLPVCFDRYRFDLKGLDKYDLHGAEMDAYCVYLLMEEYRAMIKPAVSDLSPHELRELTAPPPPLSKPQRELMSYLSNPKEQPAAVPAAMPAAASRRRGQRRN